MRWTAVDRTSAVAGKTRPSSSHSLPIRPVIRAAPEYPALARPPLRSNRSHEAAVGQITVARQQSIDRDIFVQRFPVNAA